MLDCQSNCGSHIDQHFITSDSSSFHSIDCSNYVGNYQCKSCDKDRKCTFGIVKKNQILRFLKIIKSLIKKEAH